MDFDYREEHKELKKRVRRFAEEKLRPIADEVDDLDDVSWPTARLLAEEGLFRYVVPAEYDGVGVQAMNLCIIREELARICLNADVLFSMSFLASFPIATFGSADQKRRFLPRLAAGEIIGSFSLTEPDAGSDVANIKTTASLTAGSYTLNGVKCFAANAADAEACLVFAKTDPALGAKGISAFVVDTKTAQPGLSVVGLKVMSPSPVALIKFERYVVAQDALVGEPGKGMRIALTTLDMGRAAVGGAAVGMAQGAFEEALSYARRRIAFQQPLAEFQLIQCKLADMITSIRAARLLVAQAAAAADAGAGEKGAGRASIAKLFATEMAGRVADEAVQIHGGAGLIRGCRIDKIFRGVRATRIYEGTSEIQRLTIARAIFKGYLDE
jgi:alkylation response protein AidB-like acyl-CoA dehydrogenase